MVFPMGPFGISEKQNRRYNTHTGRNKEGCSRNKDCNYFNDWNYKKHAKVCCAFYLALFAIDMTLGYVVAKKVLPK